MDQKTESLRFVARRALHGYDALPTTEKIRLLLGLAEFLPADEAQAARSTAWTIQVAEQQQLKFRGLIDTPVQSPKS